MQVLTTMSNPEHGWGVINKAVVENELVTGKM